MNDFTKEELEELRASRCYHMDDSYPSDDALFMKLESMINNYCDSKKIETIGTGQLLFHNKHFSPSLIHKIQEQLNLCENENEEKCFRIDWKILFGDKFKNE